MPFLSGLGRMYWSVRRQPEGEETHVLRYLQKDQRLESPQFRKRLMLLDVRLNRERDAQHGEKGGEGADGLEHDEIDMGVVGIMRREAVGARGLGSDRRDGHGPGDGHTLDDAEAAAAVEAKDARIVEGDVELSRPRHQRREVDRLARGRGRRGRRVNGGRRGRRGQRLADEQEEARQRHGLADDDDRVEVDVCSRDVDAHPEDDGEDGEQKADPDDI